MSKPTQRQLLEGIAQVVTTIADNMATKAELEEVKTQMATKDDLKRFATKDDLQQVRSEMATKDDLRQLESRMGRRLDSKIRASRLANTRHHLETRAMIGDLNRKFAEQR